MTKLSKIKIICTYFLFLLISNYNSFGQLSADVDGNLDVSPINGNLSYNYPISNYSIDGHPFNVSMNYSGNVVFTHFHKYVKDPEDTLKDGWIKLTRTHPAWILGVNGFAVQVLGQKFSYLSWYPGYGWAELPDKQRYQGDDNVLWLIDGYDYCNRMHELKNPDDQDVIHILKSDGSILELRNNMQRKDVSNDNDPELYTGHYYENEINSKGFAIVNFDSTFWPSYIKKYADGKSDRNSYIPRIIKYYAGDGLEYVFRETVAPYGTREFHPYKQIIEYPIDSNGIGRQSDTIEVYVSGSGLPTIFYLEEINSSMGKLTSFLRAYHYAKEDSVDVSRGRAPIIEFADHVINYGKDVLTIQSLGRTIKFKMGRKILNYNVGISCQDGCDEYNEYFNYGFGSEDNDNLTYERLYGGFFDLIDNPTTEYETSYWNYFWGGEIGLIKAIYDPENRKTEFKYGCKMVHDSAFSLPYGYSPCYFKLQEFRLDSIIEPTQLYSIEYHNGNGLVVQDEIINSDGVIDYDLISSVSQIKKFDYRNYQKGNVLETTTYDFNDNTSGSDTIYKRITSIQILDNSDDPDGLMPQNNIYDEIDISYYLKQYKIEPLKLNEPQSYYSPQLQMLYPAKIIKSTNNNSFETIIEMDSIGSRFYFMPVKKEEKVNVGDGWVTSSYEGYSYRDSIVKSFNDNYELQNAFGRGIVESKVNILRPDNKVDTLYKIINSYLNLGHQVRSISRTDSLWNRYISKVKTDSLRNLGIDTTVIVYNTVQFHGNLNVPPIWTLPKTMKIFDGEDKLLIGKINTYDTVFTISGSPNQRRGSLINDSLIGKYNVEKLPINYYSYTGGWYQNFLSTITNILGTKERYYYDYHKIQASHYFYPKGIKLMNDNSTSLKKLYFEHKEIESSIASELYVRKYNPAGYLYMDTLTTFYENTYYGLKGRIIEPNGWLYSSTYDLNGRAKKIWHPFDYPPEDNCTENDPFDPGGRQIRIYNIESTDNITTDSIFKYDTSTVRWETSTVPYQRVIGEEYSLISPYYNSYGSLSTRVVGKSDIPVSRGSRSDTIIIPDTSIVFHKDYITTFKYIKDSDDALHNCDNLDSAYLRVQYIPQETDQYLILKVVTNKFDMEKRYILDAPLIKLLNNVPSNPPPEGNRLPELKINLIPIIDSINTMNNGDTLVFKFESVTIGGAINIVDGAEDLGPTIIVVCDDCTHNDYTFAYLYNDSSRTTNYFAKIDDGLHTTSKGWVKTYDILDGRYTESIGFFGADNRFLKLDTKIGTPPSPSRIDSIIMKLSGAGKTIQMKDQDGYISKIIWRDCIPNTFTSPDNTNILVNKKVLSPNTYTNLLNVSADEYFGVCYESTTTDEAGIKNSSYYDAFGNLRRTIYDVDDKKVTTSFTYDKSGNLKFVIHPNNDTTKYWYDNFGRLKYKFNKDVDYSSNSYNKIGQIRFSQTKEQVDSCKLAYYEYDDLGRITIVGEAKVDTIGLFLHEPQIINDTLCLFNRLTDLLDPDILHYSYFNDPNFGDEGLLTANMTLYSNYTRQVPTFWNSYNIKVCIPYYTEIPYDTCPVPPFIVHPTQNYEPLDTIASIIDFENIANFPDFVRTAISYDKLPANSGSIWSNIPPDSNWQNMSPFDTLRNLKGRQVATAYRNHSGEPFHFVVFSYDPRGRIEAVLRYTENLGYDAVYYTYNSMNQILSVMVSDPIRTYKTWYGYDDNGRLDSVWTKLCNVGSGLGINIKPKFPDTTLFQIIRPDTADIVYKYNYRGMVEQIEYLPVNVVQHLNYSSRGWLDSMIALRNYDTLFNQVLEHNNTGNITKQKSKQYNQNEIIQEYNYDKLERLQNWTHGGITDNFSYDVMGNRLGHRKTDSVQFSYSASLPNRLLTTLNQTSNKLTTYNYNSIGGVKMIDSWNGVDSTKEAIYYTMEGLPNKYLKWEYGTQFQSVGEHEECAGSPTYDPAKWDWRYRYSILGGREQKRLYYSPHGDSCFGYNHPWAYYLRGAGGEQLAVYYGRQTAADTCNGTGRRVYIYPNSYITNGGELVTIPESIIQNPYGYRKEFSISDHLGSVRTIVTVSNGNVSVKGYEYQPYGEILSGTPGDDARIGFTAQERDRESSFFLMGARHYDPEIGRFLSTDPLMEFFSDQSPYSYAYNSPLIWNDPTGLFSEIAELDDYYVEIMEWTMVWGETGNDNPLAPGWGWIMQPIKRKVKIGGSGGTRGGSPQGRRGAGSYAGTASYSTNKLPKGGNYTNNNRKKQLLWDDDLVQGSTLSQHNPSFFENVRNYGVNSSWWNPIGLGINTLDDINVTVTNLTNRITMSDKPALHMDGTFATNQEIRESSVNTMVFFATLAGPKLFGNLQGSLAQKIYSIYQGIDREGIVRYIGLTGRDPTIRFMEQLGSKTEKALLDYSVILTKPTYTEGRIWEQIFINKYGLQKNGGPLLNKYNSISPKYWYQFGIK